MSGIHLHSALHSRWVPAFAGMTVGTDMTVGAGMKINTVMTT